MDFGRLWGKRLVLNIKKINIGSFWGGQRKKCRKSGGGTVLQNSYL